MQNVLNGMIYTVLKVEMHAYFCSKDNGGESKDVFQIHFLVYYFPIW